MRLYLYETPSVDFKCVYELSGILKQSVVNVLSVPQGVTVLVSTGSGAPEVPSYPVPRGVSGSPRLRGS